MNLWTLTSLKNLKVSSVDHAQDEAGRSRDDRDKVS